MDSPFCGVQGIAVSDLKDVLNLPKTQERFSESNRSWCYDLPETSIGIIPRTNNFLTGKALQLDFFPLKLKFESSLRLVLVSLLQLKR